MRCSLHPWLCIALAVIVLCFVACPEEPSGQYTCANGTPADGAPDGSDDAELCAGCNSGYVLENTSCRPERFTCDNGTPADGAPEGAEDVEQCAMCDDGYTLDETTMACRRPMYTCDGGTARDDMLTGNEDIEECAACDPGFVPEGDNTCRQAIYICPEEGTPVTDSFPTTDDHEDVVKCAECNNDFALVTADNTCAIDSDGDNTPDSEDVDDDNDGLIEIHNLDMLYHIHYNLAGTSYDDEEADSGAEGDTGSISGAPTTDADTECTTATADNVYLCGYELTRDLDFADGASYASGEVNTAWRPTTEDPPTVTDPATATNAGWPGIGPTSGIAGGLIALFDGNNFTIRNLYSRRNDTLVALVNLLNLEGHIRSLHIRDATIYGGGRNNIVASLVAYNRRGAITACTATGSVFGEDGEDGVGGLVGTLESISTSAASSGAVIASHASVAVHGGAGGDSVGGLVGQHVSGLARVIASTASGAVAGDGGGDNVGGLAGSIFSGIVIGSTASGAVTGGAGADNAGGLVGTIGDGSSVIASYATGDVAGGDDNDDAGGLVGSATGYIIASYAIGDVDGNDGDGDLGGALVGNDNGAEIITASYGFGEVDAEILFTDESRPTNFDATALTLQISDSTTNTYAGAAWNNADDDTADVWDDRSSTEAPILRYADYDGTTGSTYSCDLFPATTPPDPTTPDPTSTTDITCGMTPLANQPE